MPFPTAPSEYDAGFMARVMRQLNALEQEVRRKDVTFGRVRITDLPTSATGLAAGELWNDTGTVKVV